MMWCNSYGHGPSQALRQRIDVSVDDEKLEPIKVISTGSLTRSLQQMRCVHGQRPSQASMQRLINPGGGGQVGFRIPVENDHVCIGISIVSNYDSGMAAASLLGCLSHGPEPSQGVMQCFRNPGGGGQVGFRTPVEKDLGVIRRLPWRLYNRVRKAARLKFISTW